MQSTKAADGFLEESAEGGKDSQWDVVCLKY
jgi:hypothetical protein